MPTYQLNLTPSLLWTVVNLLKFLNVIVVKVVFSTRGKRRISLNLLWSKNSSLLRDYWGFNRNAHTRCTGISMHSFMSNATEKVIPGLTKPGCLVYAIPWLFWSQHSYTQWGVFAIQLLPILWCCIWQKIPFFSPHQAYCTQVYKRITEELTSTAATARARRGPNRADIKQELKIRVQHTQIY